MAMDALAACIARTSVIMLLTLENKRVFIFHKKCFQLPVQLNIWEMTEHKNIFLRFLKLVCHDKS